MHEEGGSDLLTEGVDRAGMGIRLDDERRRASLLGDVREAIFGAQDGLVTQVNERDIIRAGLDPRALTDEFGTGRPRPPSSDGRAVEWLRALGPRVPTPDQRRLLGLRQR